MKPKSEKYLKAGAVVVAGVAAMVLFPPLAPTIKIATIVGARSAYNS